jgi:hypothetical protein
MGSRELIWKQRWSDRYYAWIGDKPYRIPMALAKKIIREQKLIEQQDILRCYYYKA